MRQHFLDGIGDSLPHGFVLYRLDGRAAGVGAAVLAAKSVGQRIEPELKPIAEELMRRGETRLSPQVSPATSLNVVAPSAKSAEVLSNASLNAAIVAVSTESFRSNA